MGNLPGKEKGLYGWLFQHMLNSVARFKVVGNAEDSSRKYILIDANRAFEEVVGARREELLGLNLAQLLSYLPANNIDLQQIFDETLVAGHASSFEIVINRLNRWYQVNVYGYQKEFIITIMTDITVYKNTFENNPVGLIRIDFNGNIIDLNQEIVNLFQASKEDLLYSNFYDLPGIKDQKVVQQLQEQIRQGKQANGQIHYDLPINSTWINYSIRPLEQGPDHANELLISCEDVTKDRESDEHAKYLTFHDSLTGLYNRSYLNKKLDQIDTELNFPLSIIMGDVNGLKLTNDAFGHEKGDEILIAIAQALKGSCRLDDRIIRWGGDEFLILLPRSCEKAARQVCLRIIRTLKESEIGPIKPSVALGYATKNESAQDIQDLFKEAEEMMYANKLEESKNTHTAIINSLKKTLKKTTNESPEHCQRLKEMAVKLGRAMNLKEHELNELEQLAELHDLGKVAVPGEILMKPGPLTVEEWEKVKKHSEVGYQVASASPDLSNMAEGILYHHEWWDGTGYPQGLKKLKIPLFSRIINVVDSFDVMTHQRPYKVPMNKREAIEELLRGSGNQFDPDLVRIFISKVISGKPILNVFREGDKT